MLHSDETVLPKTSTHYHENFVAIRKKYYYNRKMYRILVFNVELFYHIRFWCQKGAAHQPNTVCGVASQLAKTHTCVGLAPKGLLTPESIYNLTPSDRDKDRRIRKFYRIQDGGFYEI